MSVVMMAKGAVEPAAAQPPAKAASKPAGRSQVPGGMRLGAESGREAQRLAAVILDVLAGMRTTAQAAQALGVSLPRYYQLEGRALRALVAACNTQPRGRGRSVERELAALRRQHERLQQELSRRQTLLRLAQRSLGLAPPAQAKPAPGKRRRRPAVRALQAAAHLHQQSQQASAAAEAADKVV